MHKTWVLVRKEYVARVKTKGFIVGTVVMPVFVLIMAFFPILIQQLSTPKSKVVAVYDATNKILPELETALNANTLKDGLPKYKLIPMKVQEGQLPDELFSDMNARVKAGEVNAGIVIPDSIFDVNHFRFYSKNVSEFDFIGEMEQTVSQIVSSIRLKESGLDPEKIRVLTERIYAKTFQVGDQGAREESGIMSFSLTYMMVFVMYLALLFYGSFVMRGVIEDKNSRVMEMVIASAKPFQILAGKIMGIGGAGLTQFFIWAFFMFGVSTYGLVMAKPFMPDLESLAIPSLSPWLYVAFVVYFILGFFIYASMFAALGSLVENESESQNMQMPIIALLLVAFLVMIGMVRTPDAAFGIAMSFIPFFSPIIMFMRIATHTAPLWQVLASVVINVLSIAGLIWCSGRIFRVGVLMYGKRPTLPEVMTWIKS